MQKYFFSALFFVLFFMFHLPSQAQLNYPKTLKVNQEDNYFGTIVQDPYRWLENDTAPAVKEWVIAENKVTQTYLEQIPFRAKLKSQITEMSNFPKYTTPEKVGQYYIFSKNSGLQNQSVFYLQKGLNGTPIELIDPNKIASDGTAAVTIDGASKDGKYLTYSVSQSGSDWQEIGVIDLTTQKFIKDKIKWVKFPSPAWYGNGFFYSGYESPQSGKEFSMKNEFQKIYYHKIGDTQDKDQLVFEDKNHAQRYVNVQTTEDEKFLILYIRDVGKDGMEVQFKNLAKGDLHFKPLFSGFDFEYAIINSIDDKLLINTNDNAPNLRIILVDPENSARENWKTIVPEKPELIKESVTCGKKLFVNYLKDVTSRVYQYSFDGKQEAEILLPGLGTCSITGGNAAEMNLFYAFTSFTYPSTIYRYDIATAKTEAQFNSELKFKTSDYQTKQIFYTSKDGTKIPMFITYKNGLKLNGDNPTLLYAYGGFNISKYPEFDATFIPFFENGGVYALANIRGGGEYGETWHKAGMQLNKQNVFDDFIAAAEFLIKERYTSSQKIAAIGRSNGGLLIGAVVNQRPDLFRVAFPKVGVMDMLRFQKFTVGWGWINDYGSSDSLRHFKNLYSYSPLHNIKENVAYPAIMVTTADHDDRVVPAHSFKYAATLQEKYKEKNPVLIRIDSKSGHGATGKPISKWIDEQTDIFSFMFYSMGLKF